MRVRVNAQSLRELRAPRSWPLDRPSPFEAARVLDPAPNKTLNREALAAMIELYPQFRGVHIVQQWAGYIDVTPDVVPYISSVGALPGLTVATGFSGHGFGIGPAAGRLAAELAIGEAPSVDPAPFRALPIQRRLAHRHRPGNLTGRVRRRLAELDHEIVGLADGHISGAILVALGREWAAESRLHRPSPSCRAGLRSFPMKRPSRIPLSSPARSHSPGAHSRSWPSDPAAGHFGRDVPPCRECRRA